MSFDGLLVEMVTEETERRKMFNIGVTLKMNVIAIPHPGGYVTRHQSKTETVSQM